MLDEIHVNVRYLMLSTIIIKICQYKKNILPLQIKE